MDIQSPDGPMTRVLGQYLAIRSGPKVNESKGNGFEDPRQEGKRPGPVHGRDPGCNTSGRGGASFLLGGTLGRGSFLLGEVYTLCNLKP
jgi:hypothetical protein